MQHILVVWRQMDTGKQRLFNMKQVMKVMCTGKGTYCIVWWREDNEDISATCFLLVFAVFLHGIGYALFRKLQHGIATVEAFLHGIQHI